MSRLVAAALLLMLALSPSIAAAEQLPRVEAQSLGGKKVVLPADRAGQRFILVIGFAQNSSDAMKAWSHALVAALPDVPLYAVAVVEGAPGFVHGLIARGIRKSAPASQPLHDERVLLTFDATGWKSIAPAGRGEDAAVIVVDAGGQIVLACRIAFSANAVTSIVDSLAK
jgi:hypothetical protein